MQTKDLRSLFVRFFLIFLFVIACSEKKAPEGGAKETPEPPTTPSLAALKTSTLTEIESVHCPAYESDRSNAEAAFGCFLVKLARMFESAPITDFLAAFSEPAIQVQANILDRSNPNALCTKLAGMSNKKWFGEFPNLPFNSYDFGAPGRPRRNDAFKRFSKELLKRAKNNQISVSRLQDDLFNIDAALTQLIELLAVPRAASTFNFTIPKETCQVSRDILVRKIDVEGFHGILGSIKIYVNLLHAYTIGLDPVRFATTTGSIIKREFVDDANGVGGDGKKFAELITGRGDLSALSPLMLSSVTSLSLLLDSVHSPTDSDVFGNLLSQRKYQRFFQNVNKASKDLKNSLEHPGTFTPMNQLGRPGIQIDVSQGLGHLPDPKAVSGSDPFVLDRFSRVRFVANFFKRLFTGFARF